MSAMPSASAIRLATLALAVSSAPATGAFELAVFGPGGAVTQRVALNTPPTATADRPPVASMTLFPQTAAAALRSLDIPVSTIDRAFQRPAGELPRHGAAVSRQRFALQLRRDDLDYRISRRDGHPNILSELSWREVDSLGLVWESEIPVAGRWSIEAGVGLAGSVTGTVQDSDYAEDDRRGEFSRSDAGTHGSTFFDLRLGGLYRLDPQEGTGPRLALSAGVALHNQSLRIGRAEQVIPATHDTFDADSRYTARWLGPYLGLKMDLPLSPRLDFSAGYRFERLRLRGRGDWALRDDFDHPDSFIHTAWGRIHGLELALGYRLDNGAHLELGASHLDGRASGGTDDTHWAADNGIGLGTALDLNDLRWRSSTLRLGYTLPF